MFYKRQELLTFREHLSTPQILGAPEYTPVSGSTWVHPSFREHLSTPQFMVVSVLFICLFFCVVFCVLFVFVLCLVCSMLPVSLDCLSSFYVLCAQCYQCLWIVHSCFFHHGVWCKWYRIQFENVQFNMTFLHKNEISTNSKFSYPQL
jgi:hypothetical protein